ncbi:hypothetical protein [Promicromonospora aerolata]|uniref:Uncharacterized protein n=1 Tax=Promicromonospora aerolata TaxID=195749 RepID=A0ABW4V743_9MICO
MNVPLSNGVKIDSGLKFGMIFLGMGGLMDKNLVDPSPEAAQRANAELFALADRLYQITDPADPSACYQLVLEGF